MFFMIPIVLAAFWVSFVSPVGVERRGAFWSVWRVIFGVYNAFLEVQAKYHRENSMKNAHKLQIVPFYAILGLWGGGLGEAFWGANREPFAALLGDLLRIFALC